MNYKGNGTFTVNLFKDDGSEVQYITYLSTARDPVTINDKNSGRGWKFISVGIGSSFDKGEVDIPETFSNLFGNVIPNKVKFVLRNGTEINGYISKPGRKISGLLEIIKSGYFERRDFILFTYRGNGKFEVLVFDRSKVEKMLPGIDTTTGYNNEGQTSGFQNESNCSEYQIKNQFSELKDRSWDIEDVGDEVIEVNENPGNDLMEIQEINNVPMVFTVTLTKCNVNNSSHGVYIPTFITPHNRKWQAGEDVVLRTALGSWNVGVVTCNKNCRFSAGWNTFAAKNKFKKRQQLMFTLVEEEEQILFDVQTV